MYQISSLAILAPGLLGGSLAQAKKRDLPVRIWGRNREKLKPLEGEGYALVSSQLEEVIEGADLIVLAMPVEYMGSVAEALINSGLRPGQLVTDVGSVKGSLIRQLKPILGEAGYSFIGSHPMAGSEKQGYEFARANLFEGASCIMTQDEFTKPEELRALTHFWEGVGMKAYTMSPEEHDDVISRVSHMPHLLAAVCAHVAFSDAQNGIYAGNGLKDTSRVASGDATLWAGILHANKNALLPHLEEAINRIQKYKEALSLKEETSIQELLLQDKTARDGYYGEP